MFTFQYVRIHGYQPIRHDIIHSNSSMPAHKMALHNIDLISLLSCIKRHNMWRWTFFLDLSKSEVLQWQKRKTKKSIKKRKRTKQKNPKNPKVLYLELSSKEKTVSVNNKYGWIVNTNSNETNPKRDWIKKLEDFCVIIIKLVKTDLKTDNAYFIVQNAIQSLVCFHNFFEPRKFKRHITKCSELNFYNI